MRSSGHGVPCKGMIHLILPETYNELPPLIKGWLGIRSFPIWGLGRFSEAGKLLASGSRGKSEGFGGENSGLQDLGVFFLVLLALQK